MKRLLSFILVFFLSFSLFASDKTFALVLSGGGAKGIAHIEVIKELDKRGIHPDYVIGTSIGALIGAFYASGYSGEDLERLITENDLPELFKHLYTRSGSYIMEGGTETPVSNILSIDFSKNDVGSANGIIDDQYVASFFRSNLVNVLDVRNFDDLSIPYRAIGTDLETGEEIIYSQGSLYDAMRGSMAIPIVFTPARTGDGRYVVDGGMVNNLPTDVARDLGADIVLAVDLNDVLKEHTEGKVYYDIDTLTGLTFQVLDLVTGPNAAERYPLADYVIVPDLAEIGTMDFGRADEILAIGRAAVEDNISVFLHIYLLYHGAPKRIFIQEFPEFRNFRYPWHLLLSGLSSVFGIEFQRNMSSDYRHIGCETLHKGEYIFEFIYVKASSRCLYPQYRSALRYLYSHYPVSCETCLRLLYRTPSV